MDNPAAAGIALLVLIGIGCAAGLTVAVVLLRRLHSAAQAGDGREAHAEPARAAHRKA